MESQNIRLVLCGRWSAVWIRAALGFSLVVLVGLGIVLAERDAFSIDSYIGAIPIMIFRLVCIWFFVYLFVVIPMNAYEFFRSIKQD